MNWTPIDETALKTAKNSLIMTSVQARATLNGEADPVPSVVARVIGRIRACVNAGNQLDADPTKIPNSLVDVAMGMIIRRLKTYLEEDFTEDERQQQRADDGFLNRIVDDRLKFEMPDTPADNAEMQAAKPTFSVIRPGTTGDDRETLKRL